MGQSGLTTGLALYDDLEPLRRLWAGGFPDQENARRAVATSVTFGEAWDIPVADLEAAQRHGWQLARPDAYPEVFHKDRGLSLRPPLAWELELLEGCLRAIPEFVAPAPAGRPGQGRSGGAGGLRGVEAGVGVGGRNGMRGLSDRPGGLSPPGQGCSATGSPSQAWPDRPHRSVSHRFRRDRRRRTCGERPHVLVHYCRDATPRNPGQEPGP
jgi:hypothetical protein